MRFSIRSRSRGALVRALVFLPVVYFGLAMGPTCEKEDFPDFSGIRIDPESQLNRDRAVLTFEPAGPYTVEEGQTIHVRVAGRRSDTGQLMPYYENVLVVRASDTSVVNVRQHAAGWDGATDGIATVEIVGLKAGTVELRASLATDRGAPETGTLATAGLTVAGLARELRVSPAGPITLQVGQEASIEFRVVDAAGAPIPSFESNVVITHSEGVIRAAGLELLPLDGVGQRRIHAMAPGETDVTFRYGDLPAKTVRVIVQPNAPTGRVIASTPSTRTIPGRSVTLAALIQDAAGNPLPAGETHVQAQSSNPAVASVDARTLDDADGIVEFTVRGVAVGEAQIRFTYPGAPDAVTNLSVVPAPAGDVVAVVGHDEMHVGLTIEVLARVVNPTTGAPVPGGEPHLTAVSANGSVATIAGRNAGDPNDGEVSFTLRAHAVGTTVVLFSYPGAFDATTTVVVNP